MREDIKSLHLICSSFPQLVKLNLLVAFAMLGRWLFFTGSTRACWREDDLEPVGMLSN